MLGIDNCTSLVERARENYIQRNTLLAYQDIHDFLQPLLNSSKPCPQTQELSTAWSIFFCSKLALGLPISKHEILQCGLPQFFPLFFASLPSDPFIQLEQIINFSSHFPQSLQPLVTDQFCILLKQVNNNQALELIRQATFLSPSLKNSLCSEYQPNLASSSLTSAPVLQNLSLINFILRIFDKIKLIANHNWKNLSLILLFVIWWKIRKHFNKWILWLMQLALSIV